MIALDFTFRAEVWRWKGGNWFFASLPAEVSEDIKAFAGEARRGFGSVRVEVRLGGSHWRTSVFPSKELGTFILPVKAAVRKAEGIGEGDEVAISMEVETQ